MRQGTSNHLPRNAIWHVNACRLYLNVTMLNEISTTCGKFINDWAMDGRHRNPNNTLLYPYQEKPPGPVWKTWRECILAAFLKKSSIWRPTLHRPIKRRQYEQDGNWQSKIRKGMKLEEAVYLLPGYLKETLGTITFPQDNGLQLSEEIQMSKTKSWSDGTVKDTIGAHSYTIRTGNDNREELHGTGGTPGDETTMTSLRAEHLEFW